MGGAPLTCGRSRASPLPPGVWLIRSVVFPPLCCAGCGPLAGASTHGGGEEIARDRLPRVLDPGAAVRAVSPTAFSPFTSCVVHEHDGQVAAIIGPQLRERVGELAPARQPHAQERAVTLEGDASAGH